MTTTETQDIVERLRHSANVLGNYDSEWTPDVATMRAAAAEIERLRSLTKWRPIETAPRDGTDVLVAGDGWVDAASFGPTKYHGYGWLDAGDRAHWDSYTARPLSGVTHWLPLPPPPGDTHGQKTPQSPEPLRKDSGSAVDDPPW